MPELPEIQVLAGQIDRAIRGLRVRGMRIRNPKVFGPRADVAQEQILGKTVTGVGRRGKYLRMELSPSGCVWFHLGMTGQIFWTAETFEDDPHAHFFIFFENHPNAIVYRDVRRFGRIAYGSGGPEGSPAGVLGLGPEPFEMTDQDFAARFRSRKAPIKSLLLDQRRLAGLGNIYADESLFRAGIDPRRRAGRLAAERLCALRRSICAVLKSAIRRGGSSIEDYRHLDGCRGSFQQMHRVYGRAGKPCFRCKTPVRRIVLGGRSASFCPKCQQ